MGTFDFFTPLSQIGKTFREGWNEGVDADNERLAAVEIAKEIGPSATGAASKAAPLGAAAAPAAAPASTSLPSGHQVGDIAPDEDLAVRTVMGEALKEGPRGWGAVAGVIRNRANGSGMGLRDVVLAKNQFEPWSSRRAELEGYDPASPDYQNVARAVLPILRGAAPDPTDGADHFYAPRAQAALGRAAPAWDDGSGRDIGNHRFFSLGYGGKGRLADAGAPPIVASNEAETQAAEVATGMRPPGPVRTADASAPPSVPPGDTGLPPNVQSWWEGLPGDIRARAAATARLAGKPLPEVIAAAHAEGLRTGLVKQADPTQVAEADLPMAGAREAMGGFAVPKPGGDPEIVPAASGSAVTTAANARPSAPFPSAPAARDANVEKVRQMLQSENPVTRRYALGLAQKYLGRTGASDPFEYQGGVFQRDQDGKIHQVIAPKDLTTVKSDDGTLYAFDARKGTISPLTGGKDTSERSLITPEERAQHGVDPSYKGTVQVDASGKLSFPGKPSTEIALTSEKAQDSTIGKAYGDTFNDMQKGGRDASGQLNTFRIMEKLIESPNFYSGTNSAGVTAMRRALVSLGVKDAGTAAPNELFAKLANQSVIDKLGGNLGQGVSNADVGFMTSTTANLDNSPEGNRQIIQFGKALAQRQIDVAKLAREYARAHGNRLDAGFDDELAVWADAHPMFPQATPMQQRPAPAAAPAAQPAAKAPAAPSAPPAGAPEGTRQAADGKFYVPDPARQGKWLEVR